MIQKSHEEQEYQMRNEKLINVCKSLPDSPSPPDLVPVSSFVNGCSVSSISREDTTLACRRSIFPAKYEQVPSTQGLPTLIIVRSLPLDTEDIRDYDDKGDQIKNPYESVLKQQETIQSDDKLNTTARMIRELPLESKFESYNCFPIASRLSALMVRNSTSDSALVVKSLHSCLRPTKYSNKVKSGHKVSNCSHVTFASEVSMMKYNLPKEKLGS
eukprot:CAMPEP_0194215084 /NCGR_PEP_ID=MMETSP0156-20130528/16614_1 /TAXON_ID=33649 /ORGANISM="Thalassionema nitzschioides, Strain L26-B" /LENGTH=214 /DNA_ID=CAMNT_0038943507 /DNA_START=76 /DNA_END=717 /DNA_ORIENTATION=+